MHLRPSRALAIATLLAASVTLAQTYTAWRSAGFTAEELLDPAISGPAADPDSDGVSNLLEYVFVGAPKLADTGISPVVERIDETLTLTYRERLGLAGSGVRVNLEVSDTLLNWITPNSVVEASRETFAAEGFDLVTLLDPLPPLTDAAGRRFLRLRADATASSTALKAPTAVAITARSPTLYEIAWSDWNRDETGHSVERLSPSTATWETVGTAAADTAVWQHSGADYREGFTYRVSALRSSDNATATSAPASLPDDDGDGIPNAFELSSSYAGEPGTYATSPTSFSSGGSGVSDLWALEHGFDPLTHDFSADTDADGLSDYEEAMRGTDPRSEDTDGDGISDSLDGWARHPWVTAAPLPEVRYAVVPLHAAGFPAGAAAIELDDKADVLAVDGDNYKFWRFDTGTAETVPLLSFCPTSGGNIPAVSRRAPVSHLSRGGHVISWLMTQQSSPGGTGGGIWSSGETGATPLAPVSPSGSWPCYWPIAVNGSGKVVGYQEPDAGLSGIQGGVGGVDFSSSSWLGSTYGTMAYIPTAINEADLLGVLRVYADDPTVRMGILEGNSFTDLGPGEQYEPGSFPWNRIVAITSADPVVALAMRAESIQTNTLWWAHREGGAWLGEDIQVWNPDTQTSVSLTGSAADINDRLEIIHAEADPTNPQTAVSCLIRNGARRPLADYIPAGWSDPHAKDINNHGVVLAEAKRTVNAAGNPIPPATQVTEPVLLYPIELTCEDRFVKGSVRIPEGAVDFSLSFRSTAENGLDLGTFEKLEPGAVDSPALVYASADDILSDSEFEQSQTGALDPRATSQPVVFYRDAADPRLLHFATAFDQTGEIEIALAFGPAGQRVTGKALHTLVPQTETAALLITMDQRIESIQIPELPDFDLDLDGDGIPDGGLADLIAASQPGTMSAPGPFISEAAEDDPLNLVLLVNSDDDNADGVADYLHSALTASDDDLASIVLRAPSDTASGTLTLTHDGGGALRLRFPDGSLLASGATLDLASPSGALAPLAAGSLTVYAEGLAPAADVSITLAYTPPGEAEPTLSDTVRLTVLDPAALAALRQRHRCFPAPGDLGGLLSRAYAANGAFRQHRLGLAPIGEATPLQNRGLLAKALLPIIGPLRAQAAFLRGAADGCWFGIKGDGEALGDAFFYVFMEDNRLARAKALEVAVALIPIGGTAAVLTGKIGLVLRGVVAATATGERYVLPVLDATVQASAKVTKALTRIGRSEEEVRNSVQAAQMARRVETAAGKAPLVLDELFKAKPQLGEDILKIWQEALPAAATAGPKRFAYLEADMARFLAHYGDEAEALTDDMVKTFSKLQGRMFVTEVPDVSCFSRMERMFEMETSAGRAKFRQFLEDSRPFLDDPAGSLGTGNFPGNRGFAGVPENITVPEGKILSRYGGNNGEFLADDGVPLWARSLPDTTDPASLKRYEVLIPFEASFGKVAPWFNKPGGGGQYDLGIGRTIQQLIASGHLRAL